MAAWIVCGVAGSGKTSLGRRLAGRYGLKFLDADDFHPASNLAKMRSGRPLDEADREPWLQALEAALGRLVAEKAVLAFPGLKRVHRKRMEAAAGEAHFAFLKIGKAIIAKRLLARGGFFPPDLIDSQFEALEEPRHAFILDGELSEETLETQAGQWFERCMAGKEKDDFF